MRLLVGPRLLVLLFACVGWLQLAEAGVPGRDRTQVRVTLLPDDFAPNGCDTVSDKPRLHALVVGVDQYDNLEPQFQLSGPGNDARLLASYLRRRSEIDLTLMAGAVSNSALREEFRRIAGSVRCHDTFLFYFSGHSFQPKGPLGWPSSELAFTDTSVETSREGALERVRNGLPARLLQVAIDRMRGAGVNVVLIVDANQSDWVVDPYFSSWAWHPQRSTEAPLPGETGELGAYVGVGTPYLAPELRLPQGVPDAKQHGLLSWALITALEKRGDVSSRETFMQVMAELRAMPGLTWFPVFQATAPDRALLVAGDRGPPAGGSRSAASRDIEITFPPLQRGVSRIDADALRIAGRVRAPKPPSAIMADGTPGRVNADGTFEIEVPLRDGENVIMLSAWWGDDFLPKVVRVISQAGDAVVQPGRRYALLIANQDYSQSDFPSLETPVADVEALARVLRERYGFSTNVQEAGRERTLVLRNASRGAVFDAFRVLRKVMTPVDSLLVFYAGHGIKERETDRAYWLPADARRDAPEEWLPAPEIQAAIQRLNAKHVLVVADSCYSGAFRQRAAGVDGSPAGTRLQFLDQATLRASRTFISSGADEPVADGGGGGHSVFARALLDGLAREVAPFTAGELFQKHLQGQVAGKSGQMPQYFPMREGHDGGEFVFVPVAGRSP